MAKTKISEIEAQINKCLLRSGLIMTLLKFIQE